MRKILLILFAALTFVACDNDDDVAKKSFTIDQMDGEWLFYDEESGTSAIDMTLTSRGMSYHASVYTDVMTDPKLYDSQSGFYAFFTATNSLRLQVHSEAQGQAFTADYELVDVDAHTLQLRNKQFNCIDSYFKIMASQNMAFGQTMNVATLLGDDFKASSYAVVNPNVLQVNEEGIVTAKGTGTSFVIAKSADAKVVVKVNVVSLAVDHGAEVYGDIQDVLDKYGEPDVSADVANNTAGVLYKNPAFDPSVSAIEFDYDKTSLLVTKIVMVYTSKEAYENDKLNIAKNFYEVEFGSTYYCDTEDFMTSRVHIYPFEEEGSYYVFYGSTTYLLLNGHY